MTTIDPSLRYPGRWAEELGGKPALIMAGSGETTTYAELHAYACRASRVFRAQGLEAGGHVSLCLENRIEYPALIWGAHYAGLYYTLINSRATADEIAYITADSGSTVLVLSDAVARDRLKELQSRLPEVTFLIVGDPVDGGTTLAPLLAAEPADQLDGAVEGTEMLYTSGTTGRPKGVVRSLTDQPLGNTNLVAMMAGALYGMDQDSVYLSTAPMHHAAPVKWMQGITGIGATIVMMGRFDAAVALRALEEYRVTHSQWVPTMFSRLLRLPEDVRKAADLSAHQVAIHAAAPCPLPLKQAMFDWWGPILHEYYGGTEGPATFCSPQEWLAHPGTVGKPLFGDVKIFDEAGVEQPPGVDGAVYFQAVEVEYHNDAEKTASIQRPGGMITIGDIGHKDEDGYLYLTDRKSFVINRGGANVYPQEAENLLAMHPLVADVAVIGVPDEDLGQEVKAVVQLVDSTAAGEETAAMLIAHCRDHLAAYKCPRTVDFRDELPRDDSGKLYKKALLNEFWAGRNNRLI